MPDTELHRAYKRVAVLRLTEIQEVKQLQGKTGSLTQSKQRELINTLGMKH